VTGANVRLALVRLAPDLPAPAELAAFLARHPERVRDRRAAGNAVCDAGLNTLVQALAYNGVADIASAIGVSPAAADPIYGALGTSSSQAPSASDVRLGNELSVAGARSPITSAAMDGVAGTVTLSFWYGSMINIVTREFGVFLAATTTRNSGALLSRSTYASITKLGTDGLLVQVEFGLA